MEARANRSRKITEKIADMLTAKFGTMTFLIFNAIFFLSWLAVNNGMVPGVLIFDPFPYGLLTTIVSLEAIFLAIIVLISQNRAAKIDDLREEIDLTINTIAEEEITKIVSLLVILLKKHGIDVSKDPDIETMIQPTDTQRIEKSIEKQMG
jgi:uncharacterized membrane protein